LIIVSLNQRKFRLKKVQREFSRIQPVNFRKLIKELSTDQLMLSDLKVQKFKELVTLPTTSHPTPMSRRLKTPLTWSE